MTAKIKKLILDEFASRSSKPDECLDERWVLHQLLPTLNPKEQDMVNNAISELESEGLISTDKRMGMVVIVLSEKGFDKIYPFDSDVAKRKIRAAILDEFVSRSARVGHCIDERWLMQQFLPTLNPKERGEVDATIDDLASEGLIETGQGMSMLILELTEKGYDVIY